MAQVRVSKWVHFHLGVDRFRYRGHWGAITLAAVATIECFADGDVWTGLRMARKATTIHETWQVQSGRKKQLGSGAFIELLVQFLRGAATRA